VYVEGKVRSKLGEVLLTARSPHLEDLTLRDLAVLHDAYRYCYDVRHALCTISRVLKALGLISDTLKPGWSLGQGGKKSDITAGIAEEWVHFVHRWRQTTTISTPTRNQIYWRVLKVGRWITRVHPEAASPALWTRDIAAEYVAAALQLRLGDWTNGARGHPAQGKPHTAREKASYLYEREGFFRIARNGSGFPDASIPRAVLQYPVPLSL
jgi:hypothetical protein